MEEHFAQTQHGDKALRLLVIHSGAIGDTIVMSVVYQALRRHFPQAYLDVIGQVERLRLINLPGLIDRITSIERSDIAELFSTECALSSALIAYIQQFERILAYSFDHAGALMNNLRRIHPEGVLRFDPFPGNEASEHVTHYLLRTLRPLGIEDQEPLMPRIALAERMIPEGKNGSMTIAVHLGSGSPRKNWPVEYFADVCKRLAQTFSVRFQLIIGPAEHPLAQKFTRRVASHCALTSLIELPLPELARELQQCDLYIGNDSGISHLAAALGVPTIAIFRASNPAIWQPVGKRMMIFHDRSASGGAKITVDDVYHEAARYLNL